jgi:hypothetical protein
MDIVIVTQFVDIHQRIDSDHKVVVTENGSLCVYERHLNHDQFVWQLVLGLAPGQWLAYNIKTKN